MRALLILVCLVFSSSAMAGSADDMCTLMTVENHGVRCTVQHYGDGSRPTLLIKNYVKADADETKKARARLAVRQVTDAHLRDGGGGIEMRTQRKDGAWVQRSCNKIKGRMSAHCEPWAPVKG